MVGVARLIVNHRDLCHHSRPVRVRAPSLQRHYPASSVVRTHPPSEAADAGPHGFFIGFGSWPFPRRQTSLVAHCPCSVRSATITPVGPPVAYLARFPGGVGLPRYSGGSAPTLALSRPAQCSLALRLARSADLQKRPFLRVLQTIRRLLIRPSASGWSESLPARSFTGEDSARCQGTQNIGQKTRIRQCDDESASCNASSQLDPPSAS